LKPVWRGSIMPDEIAPLFSWRSAICESDLGPTTRLVALVISLYMNEMGESAFPSGATIAHKSGLSDRAVWTHIERLESEGWLSREKRFVSRNKVNLYATSNLYHVHIPSAPPSVPLCTSFSTPLNDVQTNSSDNSSVNKELPFGEDFEIAYKVYPRHEGRVKAHRAYVAQRRKGANPDELLVACKKMQIDCRGTDTKYIKLMATFLGPDDWWREKLGKSDTNVESPATLCPTCGLEHRGAPCPFEQAQAERG
jgi:DNA-binding Lrp family transcriptional regulator